MGIKVSFKYKWSTISSVLLLTFLLIFVSRGGEFNARVTGVLHEVLVPDTETHSFELSDTLLSDHEIVTAFHSSAEQKLVTYRKKLRRAIESHAEHSLYVKDVEYSYDANPRLNLNYESPHFVRQQESFLFRLSVF
jgi:hypothetical protein